MRDQFPPPRRVTTRSALKPSSWPDPLLNVQCPRPVAAFMWQNPGAAPLALSVTICTSVPVRKRSKGCPPGPPPYVITAPARNPSGLEDVTTHVAVVPQVAQFFTMLIVLVSLA